MNAQQRPTPLALVTGASSGIGYQYARLLAEKGYDLLLVSNEEIRIAEVARELRRQFGVRADGLCRDLSLADAADSLFEYTRQQGFEVEVLVNNAGVFFFDDLTETDSRRIERMIGLHVQTVTMLCRYFGAAMKARGKGYILNMSSMSAGMPFPGISVYAATKSYLKQFSKAIHNELYDYGVRVTAVCPGAVATDLYNLSGHYQRLGLRLGILRAVRRTPVCHAGRGQPPVHAARGARSVAADPADQTSCKILPLWKISRYTSSPEPAAASARR